MHNTRERQWNATLQSSKSSSKATKVGILHLFHVTSRACGNARFQLDLNSSQECPQECCSAPGITHLHLCPNFPCPNFSNPFSSIPRVPNHLNHGFLFLGTGLPIAHTLENPLNQRNENKSLSKLMRCLVLHNRFHGISPPFASSS